MEKKHEGAIWLEVGLLRRIHRPTGIPRMIQQILHHWRGQGVNVRTCYFDPARRIYREGDERSSLAAAPLPRAMNHLRRVLGRVKSLIRRVTPGPIVPAARRLLNRTRNSIGRVPVEAPFAPGDTLFLAGPEWDHNAARDVLPRLREACGLRVILVVYDIIPLRCQHLVPGLKAVFENWLPKGLAAADLVLTISDFSRRDLLRYCRQYALPCPAVQVIRLGDEPGVDTTETRPATPALVPDRGFALCVGSISHHKNQWLLLRVWRRLLRTHGSRAPQLVFVGGGFGRSNLDLREFLADDEDLAGHVIYCADANDDELRWLYRHCRFTLFPSHYEGWGLPVAEGLSYGKPCICSSSASLPEVGGPLVDYHDSYDGGECLRLVERAAFEPGWLEQRERRILSEFRVTTWADTARQILAAMRQELLPAADAPLARAG